MSSEFNHEENIESAMMSTRGVQARLIIDSTTDGRRQFFSKYLMGDSNDKNELLYPLYKEGGVVFPYMPTQVSQSHSASYQTFDPTHSNFQYNRYTNSSMSDIQLSVKFTAATQEEFRYTAAALHFLKTVTKMHYGQDDQYRGTPPPVLRFSYGGRIWYQDLPVVLTDVTILIDESTPLVTLASLSPKDIDWEDGLNDNVYKSALPLVSTVTLSLRPHFRPEQTRKEFNLKKFATGGLLGKM
jgi:hypothetical protein